MKNKYILLAIIILTAGAAKAQVTMEDGHDETTSKRVKNEFSVNAFGGLQTLSYKVEGNASVKNGFGGGAGIGYCYNFSKSLAIGTGVDLSYYSASVDYPAFDGAYVSNEDVFKYSVTNYSEKQTALLAEIPLMLRYSLPIGKSALQLAGGVKFGLPVSTQYTASADGHETTSVYLEYESQQYEFEYDYTPVKVNEYTGNFDMAMAISLQVEVAYRIALSNKKGLAVGAYFNYGLNNAQKDDKQLVTYKITSPDLAENPPAYVYSSSLLNTDNVSSLRPFAVGLKLRLDLGF